MRQRQLEEQIKQLREENEQLQKKLYEAPQLVDIRTEKGKNVFTFSRAGQSFNVKTYSTMQDRPDEWRAHAGLK